MSSIHPRVVDGRTHYAKVNTSKKKSASTVKRVLDRLSKHLSAHPNDGMSQSRKTKLEKMMAAL